MTATQSAHEYPLYKLTYYQNRFWNMEKATPDTSAYVLSGLLTTSRFSDGARLEKAILAMIRNNDATRLRLTETSAGACQYVCARLPEAIEVHDFSNDAVGLQQWIGQQAPLPFQLQDASLFEIAIVRTGRDEYGVFFKAHHISGDEWSSRLLATQIYENYLGLEHNDAAPNHAPYSYLDYVRSESAYMQSQRFLTNKVYWETKFSDLSAPLLASAASTTSSADKAAGFQACHLDLAPYGDMAYHDRVYLLGLSLAAFARYFQTARKQTDVVFGLPIHNRVNHREKNTIGMFANSALLRVTLDEHADRSAIAETVRKELKELLRNQRYPYPLLKEYIEARYGIHGHLYNTYVSYTHVSDDRYQLQYFVRHTQYCPLIVRIYRQTDRNALTFHFYYWEAEYSPEEIAQLFDSVREQFRALSLLSAATC